MPPLLEAIAFIILLGLAPLPKSEPWQDAQLALHNDLPFSPAARRASASGLATTGVVVVAGVVAEGSVLAVLVPPPQPKSAEIKLIAKIILIAVVVVVVVVVEEMFECFKVIFPFFIVSERMISFQARA
jgi:hypothetical protein